MQFLALVYVDNEMLEALPAGEPDAMMRTCLRHADELHAEGKLVGFQQLEDAHTAKSVRIRGGRTSVVDGPRSEEHTSELQSLMRLSYSVLCFKTNNTLTTQHTS